MTALNQTTADPAWLRGLVGLDAPATKDMALAKAAGEIERLQYALAQCGNGYGAVSAYARAALAADEKLVPYWSRNARQ